MADNFITDEYTAVLQKLVREVVNDPSTYLGHKYMPSVVVPSRRIRVEVIEASGGLTNEHVVGSNPAYIQSFGSRVQEFIAPAYKEAIHYDEDKILYFRELGQNDPSMRGVQQYIDVDVDRLNRRIEGRMELLRWNTIFNGGFTFGGKTISFGVPANHQATPLGAKWSLNGTSANASATPLVDLRYWLLGGYAPFRKYKFSKIVMNPNTARFILDNATVQSLIQYHFAAENFPAFELDKTLRYLIPGLPECVVYDGWYQSESIVNGQITVSDAVYFIPDGYLFFECSSLPGNDKIGEFVQGINLATGTIDAPGSGKFLIIEDNTAPGTQGGPKNPFIDLIGGVYGGPKLDRAFDVCTAVVV
jgi:hypothetical protein